MTHDEALSKARRLIEAARQDWTDWSEETLTVWLECNCHCVFCDRDLLAERSIAFHLYSVDHLLSKDRYPEMEFEKSNWVLACRECNVLKGRWDPNREAGIYTAGHRRVLSSAERQRFVELVSKWLKTRRESDLARFSRQRQAIDVILRSR